MSKAKNGDKWFVKFFNNDHNHPMVSPRSVSYLRCLRKMGNAAKSLVEKFDEEGMPIGKVTTIFNTAKHSFFDRDC